MSIRYTYSLEIVRLPGKRRQHMVAAITGDPFPFPFDPFDPSSLDWPEIKATLLERDRWLVWRAGTTVCGLGSAPWDRDVSDLTQHCGRCRAAVDAAYDAAPEGVRALVQTGAGA